MNIHALNGVICCGRSHRNIPKRKFIVKKGTVSSCSSLEKVMLKLQNDTVFVV